MAHVKVHADLTSPLPPVVEFKRQNGNIIPVKVEYPWNLPSCSFCKQIGHIQKDCLLYTPAWAPADKNKESNQASSSNISDFVAIDNNTQDKDKGTKPPQTIPQTNKVTPPPHVTAQKIQNDPVPTTPAPFSPDPPFYFLSFY